MQAIILAAGRGQRLGELTYERPKCLLELNDGRSLIEHLIAGLARYGIDEFLIVTGYMGDLVREHLKCSRGSFRGMEKSWGGRLNELIVDFADNAEYWRRDNFYSLWLVRDRVHPPFLVVNGDLYLSSFEVVGEIMNREGCVLAVDMHSQLGREEMKVRCEAHSIVELGKDLPPDSAHGEYIGLAKFDEQTADQYFYMAGKLASWGLTKLYYEDVLNLIARCRPLGLALQRSFWCEVDTEGDYQRIRTNR